LRMRLLFGRMLPSSEVGFGRGEGLISRAWDRGILSMYTVRLASQGLAFPTASLTLAMVLPTKSFWRGWFVNFILRRYFLLKIMPDIIKVLRCGLGLMPIVRKLNPGSFLPILPNLTLWNPFGDIQGVRALIIIFFQRFMRSFTQSKLYSAISRIILVWWKIILHPIYNCHKLCRFI